MVSVRLDAGPRRVPELEGQPVPLHGLARPGHIQALDPPLKKLKNSCYCNSNDFLNTFMRYINIYKDWIQKIFCMLSQIFL